ncbi:hypothetical protein [Pseudaestuariivita rosea]|uniref:hypothetical protein n=1 Tax=Pseudaestuariivita rosea TaxID=2763263 RepID=UPI001ABAFB68|nr:hypothetical protein [Pseudaestuariivita rosea]
MNEVKKSARSLVRPEGESSNLFPEGDGADFDLDLSASDIDLEELFNELSEWNDQLAPFRDELLRGPKL